MNITLNMADLKTQESRLNAEISSKEYDKALKDTVTLEEMLASAVKTRGLMLSLVSRMESRLLDAIDNEFDETRVHYLMSDAMLDIMRELAHEVDVEGLALPEFAEYFKRGAKPRDLLTVSQWADRNRWLQSGTNSPGRWNTALTPYLREIMDSLSEHSPVRDVTFIKSSGVGGTEGLYNWIGYVMHHLQNKDLLVVVPTLELRDRSFNPRLAKMIDETEALAELVSHASRSKTNRVDLMEYGARSRIIKAGANSPDSLRSDHLPYVICDEVDAFPWDVGGEGDPMTLIENRQRTFSRAKSYFVSTPTNDQASRIEVLYKRSDKRRYHVPCPHCGEFQVLKFGGKDKPYGLKWKMSLPKEDEPSTVESTQYLCEHCGAYIDEGHKTNMLAAGRWIAERPSIKAHRGYHLNALYAPIGLGLGWKSIAQKWLSSQHDTSELKAFINTYLGEVFKEQGEEIESGPLMMRCEVYTGTPWLVITAGVDVQKDRIEVSFVGWGIGEEAWLIDHVIIPGDTAQTDVWDELHSVFNARPIKLAVVDYGYNSTMVAEFVRLHKYAVAGKGFAGTGRPLVEDEKKRKQRLRVKRKKGVPVEPLGVDQGKGIIYSRLKKTEAGAGYIHFPQDGAFDEEYFAQLTAEKLVLRIKGMRTFYEWVQTRPRNEALDCFNYALAALKMLNVDLSAPGKQQQSTQPKTKASMQPIKKHNPFTKEEW
ncbi:MAG: phage terminase large subunit family protein [Hydrogenophaga sp.]|nr:phage terminase large subunit family protein [Hydrogenophaga sp.]